MYIIALFLFHVDVVVLWPHFKNQSKPAKNSFDELVNHQNSMIVIRFRTEVSDADNSYPDCTYFPYIEMTLLQTSDFSVPLSVSLLLLSQI